MTDQPSYLVFSQHGMVDTSKPMAAVARRSSDSQSRIIAPDLGYFNTIFAMEPLIQTVERIAIQEIADYPDIPIRIMGMSLGGVIWTELLTRHPEWWPRVESFILIGSPIGGAHLAKMADPLGLVKFTIADELGRDRRPLAEAIAKVIPTLIIAGDCGQGSDKTVLVQTTQFKHAHFVLIPGVDHPGLRFCTAVDAAIREFWSRPRSPKPEAEPSDLDRTIETLRSVPGMTDASPKYFKYAKDGETLADGSRLWQWTSPIGVKHVFLENASGDYCFGGYVGWVHHAELERAIGAVLFDRAPSP
jgi:pimeloyl-ACP methyl ester carboxylesterase